MNVRRATPPADSSKRTATDPNACVTSADILGDSLACLPVLIPAIRYPKEKSECQVTPQVLMNVGSVPGKIGCATAPPIAWSASSNGVWIGAVPGLVPKFFQKTPPPPSPIS